MRIALAIDRLRPPRNRLGADRGWLPAVVAMIIALCNARAIALDSSRALTQCVHRIWQTSQGLPEPTITCIRQTHDGYLWLGTRTGLVRFDGVRFTSILDRGDVKLEDTLIHDLREDDEHNLWVATEGAGLIRLQGDEPTRFGRTEGLPSNNVRCLLVDRQGRLWAGTDNGLARFAAGKFVVHAEAPDWPAFDVHAICQDSAGQIWIAGDHARLCSGNGETFSPHALDSIPLHETLYALVCSADGAIWIGASNGLVSLDHGQEHRITTADGLANDMVYCLAEGRDQSLWVGTKDGFSRVRGGEIESFRTAEGLSQSTVYAICEDHEGSLWVGTKHGLNQFVDRRTIPFTLSEGLPSNNTGPVLQDRSGTIWVGTLDAGLARFDGRRFSAVTSEPGLVSKTVRALADGEDGDLWIGTEKGLCRMRAGNVVETFTTQQGLPSDSVQCLGRDHQAALWVGTAAGLARFRDGRFESVQADDSSDGGSILAMVDDGAGLLVSIEDRGIYRVDNGKLETFSIADDSSADVDAFYRDADGLIWMGTRGSGLRLIDGDRVHRFTSKDGLYDDDIFGITADDEDRLWMACSKGIFSVERSDLRKFAAGSLGRVEATAFTPLDALRTIECQEGVQPVVQKAQDGRIWFSTIRGLLVVDPHHLLRQLPPTKVVIEELVVNGRNENPHQAQTLGPGQANLSFRYAALSYASPSRITFRYRLDGFDKDWVDAGNRREAFYTNLSPGSYRFHVAALNTDGKQYEAASPVDLTIAPYFYQTLWFWPSCGALLIVAGWLVYRLRVRRIKQHLNVVLAERSRIARELHDTLMQGFSGVTMEMQAFASQLPPSSERSTLNGIIQDAGNCLREARRSVAGLRGDQSGLAASLAQAARQLTETNDVRLKLHLEDGSRRFPPDVEYNLLRVAQEGISNAVKHSGARTIEVILEPTPRELRLSIRDDGAGFDTAIDSVAGPGHYGLIGMRERARQIGADLHLESEPGRGTLIRIVLPTSPAGIKSTV